MIVVKTNMKEVYVTVTVVIDRVKEAANTDLERDFLF